MQTERVSTRRRAIGQLAVAATLPAAATVASPIEDPHLAWERVHERARAEYEASSDRSDERLDAHSDGVYRIEGLILLTPATTAAGAHAQLRMVHHLLETHRTLCCDGREIAGMAHAIATLDRLAGRAVA
jgi:hypothetical protein